MQLNHSHFYGDNGISRSEAQHLTNVLLVRANSLKDGLKNFSVISSTFTDNTGKVRYYKAYNPLSKENIVEKTNEMGKLFGAVAYFREAIKAGKNYISFLENLGPHRFLTEEGELEKYNQLSIDLASLKQPTPAYSSEENILSSLDYSTVIDFFEKEAICSHIGQLIHDDGEFNKKLKPLINIEPSKFHTVGNQVYIIDNTPQMSVEDMTNIILELQAEHRESNKKVNYLKSWVKDELAKSEIENSVKYSDEYYQYTQKKKTLQEEYDNFNNVVKERRLKAIRDFSEKKIFVPERYKFLLEESRKNN